MNHYSLVKADFNQTYQDTIDQAITEYEQIFSLSLNQKICFIYLHSREQFDDVMGRKTKPFETAYSNQNFIFLMHPGVFEQESNKKYDEQKTILTLRHEVCHKFFQHAAWRTRPTWLNEGTCIYFSGQLKNFIYPKKFSEFLLFSDKNAVGNKTVYPESGFVVEKLVSKFGQDKFIDFLKSLRNSSQESFPHHFKNFFGFELNYDNINNL